jgi:hypothetical protein
MARASTLSKAERRKRSARLKRLKADPAFQAKQIAASSAHMKGLRADPVLKAKHAAASSARMKRLRADPAFEAKLIAAITAAKKRQADAQKQAAFSQRQR